METPKSKFLTKKWVITIFSIHEVNCLGCGATFEYDKPEPKQGKKLYPVSAIPCPFCYCAFNVNWDTKTE